MSASEMWLHTGMILTTAVTALLFLAMWFAARAYVGPHWDEVRELILQGLEDRRWRERSLPMWVHELAPARHATGREPAGLSELDRLALLTWARGEEASCEVRGGDAVTRRGLRRLEGWVNDADVSVERLVLTWRFHVAQERLRIAAVGVRRAVLPIGARVVRRAAQVGAPLAVVGMLLALVLMPLADTLGVGGGWLGGWVSSWVTGGALIGLIVAIVDEARQMPHPAGAPTISRGRAALCVIAGVGLIIGAYSMRFWLPNVQEDMARWVSQFYVPEGLGVVGFAALLIIVTVVGLATQALGIADKTRTTKERSNSALFVTGGLWLLLCCAALLSPDSILTWERDVRETVVVVLTVLFGLCVCAHAALAHLLFRRRLKVVCDAGIDVPTTYRVQVLGWTLAALPCLLVLTSWAGFMQALPAGAQASLALSIVVALLVLLWQGMARWRWTRKVDKAYSRRRMQEAQGSGQVDVTGRR